MPLALLPSSNLLLEAAPEVLQQQLELIPGQLGASKAASLHKVVASGFSLVQI